MSAVMEDATRVAKKASPLASASDTASFKYWSVAGVTLLVLDIFRKPIMTNLPILWTLSGDFCQTSWNQFLDRVGDDPLWTWFLGTMITVNSAHIIVGGLFTWMDLTLSPEALRKYKTQPGVNEPVDKKTLRKVLGVVFFNQIVIATPFYYCTGMAAVWRTNGVVRELPSFPEIILSVLGTLAVEEIFFYYGHRLLHHRLIYRHIHKTHHEFTSPIAAATLYCHPVEHVVSSMFPTALGLVLSGAHVLVGSCIAGTFMIASVADHCGYHLPFFRSPEFHDFHHVKFTQNYGVLGILDRLHGTDSLFVSSGFSRRHHTLLSLVPVRVSIPLTASNGKEL